MAFCSLSIDRLALLIGLFAMFFLAVPRVKACDCMAQKTCGALRTGDADFVAHVLSKRLVHKGEQVDGVEVLETGWLFEAQVLKHIKGQQFPGQLVKVKTGQSDTDCAYIFDLGKDYLIDAIFAQGMLHTNICSLTGVVSESSVIQRELELEASGSRAPDLAGQLTQDERLIPHPRTLTGLQVVLHRDSGGPALRAPVETDGSYRFAHLSNGKYLMTIEGLPNDLTVDGSSLYPAYRSEIPPLEIAKQGESSAACRVEISLGPSGSIQGTVRASPKALASSFVTAYKMPVSGKEVSLCERGPEKDGSFRLPFLPGGHYRIAFEYGSNFQRSKSVEVDLKDGQQITDLSIRVP